MEILRSTPKPSHKLFVQALRESLSPEPFARPFHATRFSQPNPTMRQPPPQKNKLVAECKVSIGTHVFFQWAGWEWESMIHATPCARDNLMPACGSPSICNLGVVRRRSFTAAAPEVAILAQSLSDGTLLTRVVCETAGCDFLVFFPLFWR